MPHTITQRISHYTLLGIMPLFLGVVPMSQQANEPWHIQPIIESVQATPAAQPILPAVAEKVYTVAQTIRLTVTAYSSTVDQTDGDPFTTASGAKVADGIIAHNYLPFGTKVRFPDVYGNKIFVVQDRLNARYGYYIADMWMPSRSEAIQWGAHIIRMEILES